MNNVVSLYVINKMCVCITRNFLYQRFVFRMAERRNLKFKKLHNILKNLKFRLNLYVFIYFISSNNTSVSQLLSYVRRFLRENGSLNFSHSSSQTWKRPFCTKSCVSREYLGTWHKPHALTQMFCNVLTWTTCVGRSVYDTTMKKWWMFYCFFKSHERQLGWKLYSDEISLNFIVLLIS